MRAASASLVEARKTHNKTMIYAPVSGTVSKLNVKRGERVVGTTQMAGTEIMRIANLHNMEVRVNVNEDKDRYETQIFVVPSDGSAAPRPLTSGRKDRTPRWSPSGREIACDRTPEHGEGKTKAEES